MRHLTLIPMFASATFALSASLVAYGACDDAPSPTPDQGLMPQSFEGNWLHPSPWHVGGYDTILEMWRKGDSWTITFTSISVHNEHLNRNKTVTVRGPFEAQMQDGVLTYIENGRKREHTIKLEKRWRDCLVLPAINQVDAKTWVFKAPDDIRGTGTRFATFECEHDPRIVPVGTATVRGTRWTNEPRFYVYEEDEFSKRLRFLNRGHDGLLYTVCKFYFDQSGSPQFHSNGAFRLNEVRYFRMPDDEFERLMELAGRLLESSNKETEGTEDG